MGSVPEIEPESSETVQVCLTGEWRLGDAVIVGVVAYTASVLLLLLTMFAVYSVPSLHSRLWANGLDLSVYTLAGLVGGTVFGGPLVMWFVRRRNIANLARSIQWECSNKVLGWTLLSGFVFGIVCSLLRAALAGRGYRPEPVESIIAFVLFTGLAGCPILAFFARVGFHGAQLRGLFIFSGLTE